MRALVVALIALPFALQAGEYDGIYRPAAYPDWDCKSIGMDGGALAVRDGKYFGVESVCDLTAPVAVRGMEATLFDMVCSAEGEQFTDRVLIARNPEGITILRGGYATQMARCPG